MAFKLELENLHINTHISPRFFLWFSHIGSGKQSAFFQVVGTLGEPLLHVNGYRNRGSSHAGQGWGLKKALAVFKIDITTFVVN
jgi:hypothetical protein